MIKQPGRILLVMFSLVTGTALATQGHSFPQHQAIPGGVAIIAVQDNTSPMPTVSYENRRVLVRANQQVWEAVVGIPLSASPGIHKITVTNGSDSYQKEFRVVDKDYETTHITINNKRMVSPSQKDIERHWREKKLINKAIRTWSDSDNVEMQFIKPVEGRFSSPFGLKRIYNNQERIRRHTGLDIAAPVGSAILSPAGGTVISTGDYFFTGNTVFIDHGQGLLSMYCHLNKIAVKAGDVVKQGDYLGEVGMTGRVSGPHLHWSVFLNQFKVDPTLFFAQTE